MHPNDRALSATQWHHDRESYFDTPEDDPASPCCNSELIRRRDGSERCVGCDRIFNTMTTTNEPKYHVTSEGKIANRQSGQVIPDDEPIFILRARDIHALAAINGYLQMPMDDEHRKAVSIRFKNFADFAEKHPERMKMPDTVITDDWKP